MTTTQLIKATANKSARTFTLRMSWGAKYRTFKMNEADFRSCERNTQSDWANYLKSDEYYVIKK